MIRKQSARPLRRAPGAWRRFFAAIAALLAVGIGIPAALVAVTQGTLSSWHPLPGIGSSEEIRQWFERELSTSEVIPIAMRVLLGCLWLLWCGLMSSVLSAVVSSRPRLDGLRLPRMALFDGPAQWIAAGLTALSALAPNVSHASLDDATPAPIMQPVDQQPEALRGGGVELVSSRPGWSKVQAGESIEMFAARTVGDASRWPEIWELNRGRQMDETGVTWREPWRLLAGWELELPTGDGAATSETAAAARGLHLVATDPPTPPADEQEAAAGSHGVVAGESYWSIAERALRDVHGRDASPGEVTVYMEQLVAVNAGRLGYDDPHMLRPGDHLELPTPDLNDGDQMPAGRVHVVVAGESYWSIAEQELTVGGVPPDRVDVLVYVDRLVAVNAGRLGYDDPHMLHPGDQLQLDVDQTQPPHEQGSELPAPNPSSRQPDPNPLEEQPGRPQQPSRNRPERPERPPANQAPPVEQPPVPQEPPQDPDPADAPAAVSEADAQPAEADNDDDGGGSSSLLPVPQALAAMSVLAAAGLSAAFVRGRRRSEQRPRAHEQLPPLSDRDRQLTAQVLYRDVSDVTWVDLELRWMAHHIDPTARGSMTAQLVQLGPQRQLEVAWASPPAVPPPAGWAAAADRVWRLAAPHDDSELSSVQELPPVLPALVTLGDRTDDTQLYLNVEAVDGLNVTGDRGLVRGWISNVVWEIANEAISDHPEVLVVDADVDGVDALENVVCLGSAEALDRLERAPAVTSSILDRRVNQWESWPPTIVVLGPEVASEPRWSSVAARGDVAVLVAEGDVAGGMSLVLAGNELRIDEWGVSVAATQMAAATAAAATEVLELADEEPVPDDVMIPAATGDTPIIEVLDDFGDGWECPSWPVTVHLLGEPHATRNGEPLSLTPQQLGGLAVIALRGEMSFNEFRYLMWGDEERVPDQRVRDLLSGIRQAAGGVEVVSRVEDGRFRAGPDLGTDIAMFEALTSRAQQEPDELCARLHETLYLVEGRPFAYPESARLHWRWVDVDHLEASWSNRVATVAVELARLYLGRDDPGAARDIAERGLRADPLSAPLTEALMEAYAGLQAVEAAQQVYEAHDRMLCDRDFGGASQETRRVLERIRAAAQGGDPSEAAVSS